jgi:hypothetical protein
MDLLALDGQSGRVVAHKFDCVSACHLGHGELFLAVAVWNLNSDACLAVRTGPLRVLLEAENQWIPGSCGPQGQKSGGGRRGHSVSGYSAPPAASCWKLTRRKFLKQRLLGTSP